VSKAVRDADLSGVPINEVSGLERMLFPGLALPPSIFILCQCAVASAQEILGYGLNACHPRYGGYLIEASHSNAL
jgi:hypothetical protein